MESFAQSLLRIAPEATQAGHALWLIIALPLLGAFISGAMGKIIGRSNVHLVAVSAVAGSFLLSLLVFLRLNDPSATSPSPFGGIAYAVGADFGTWFQAGAFKVTLGLTADHLSGSMLLVITGIGTLIHIYATGYMAHDPGYWRFFAYLNLFVAMMLTLVLADSLPLLFVGWEGVGMCSYLLIGFWYEDKEKAYAGRKAFITNRIGDFGFLVASFVMVLVIDAMTKLPAFARIGAGASAKGPLSFAVLEEVAKGLPQLLDTAVATGPLAGFTYGACLTGALLLFMLGAAGKSAQFPLYVWLPDAMAGPTPVSALIHAATMVTSGIYLFCRISYLLVLSPRAMAVVALVGAFTALLAALIAVTQTGLKKVLAYSTVSQLGLMFLGIGAGAFWAAFLHVVTHAFFKACLFLGAGSVMHGNANEEDITKLGGVRREMKWTWITFAVATVAITGFVPLSGFFSKDAILHAAHVNQIPLFGDALHFAYVLGTLTAFGTAFYMTRLYWLTFEGTRSPEAKVRHAHESGFAMVMPLVVLAIGAIVFAVHGFPSMHVQKGGETVLQAPMENFLEPVFATTHELVHQRGTITIAEEHEVPWGVYAQAWLIALAGTLLAVWLYAKVIKAGFKLPTFAENLRRLSFGKFYVDEVYDYALIRPVRMVAKGLYSVFDAVVIDGTVHTIGRVTAWTGSALRYAQTGDAQAYAAVMALSLAGGLLYALLKVMP